MNYKALQDLKNSEGWKILTDELDKRIKSIEDVLLTPTTDDMFWKIKMEEQITLLNYKKAERAYLIELKELPENLINTKVTVQKEEDL